MKNKTSILFLAVLSIWGLSQGMEPLPPDIERIVKCRNLVVAMANVDMKGFCSPDSLGRLVGVDVDLANDIAENLGVTVRINRDSPTYDGVVDLVANRKADIAISFLSITTARAMKVNFTVPYAVCYQALAINRLAQSKTGGTSLSPAWINSPAVRIGVVRGSSYMDFARRDFPKAVIFPSDNWDNILVEASSGRIQAALLDDIQLEQWMNEHPENALYVRMQVLRDKEDPIAIAAHWKDTHLLRWLNIYLATALREGSIKAMKTKYNLRNNDK